MSECRKCGAEIFWHKSKSGKAYPTNSATDRRDFHNCSEAPPTTETQSQAAQQPLGATLAERVEALESTVAALVKETKQLGAQLPITDEDIPF